MPKETPAWSVRRHVGRKSDEWKVLYEGDSEEAARETYDKMRRQMRQGSVELHQAGEMLDSFARRRPDVFAKPMPLHPMRKV